MIRCENVNKIYKTGAIDVQVLKNISLTIKEGEFVAIVGPSGSGKSTLMHILGVLDKPSSGKYYFDEQDVSDFTENKLAEIRSQKVGFVFQSFNLLSRSTVMRNVLLPLIYDRNTKKEERKSKAEKALLASGLDRDRWYHLSNQLSGGQMQRVAIARALVNEPAIILADEPTGNLDTKTGKVVLATFKKLNQEKGHTIIIITHDQEVADFADRKIEIQDGQIFSDQKNI